MMMFTRPIGAVPPPIISPSNSAISSSQAISITISGSAVSAEYSFDGENWVTYSAPFTISADSTIYARAIDARGEYSRMATKSYTIIPYDAEVEYLQCTTTQWIGTAIVPDFGTTVEVKAAMLVNSDYHVISARTGTGTANRFFVFSWAGSAKYRFTMGAQQYDAKYTFGETPHIVIFNEQETHTCYFDGVAKKTFTAGNTVSVQNQLTIFGTSGYTEDCTCINNVRIYYCKITQNGVLVRDYIPVRIGQVGYMYDKVSGQLFGNDGTGDFVLGNDVV